MFCVQYNLKFLFIPDRARRNISEPSESRPVGQEVEGVTQKKGLGIGDGLNLKLRNGMLRHSLVTLEGCNLGVVNLSKNF